MSGHAQMPPHKLAGLTTIFSRLSDNASM